MAITYETALEIVNGLSNKDKDRIIIHLTKEKEQREGNKPVKEKELTEAEIIVKKALKRNQINNAKKNKNN